MFRHKEVDSEWVSGVGAVRYRALRRADLECIAAQVGWSESVWHFPDQTGRHQPLLTARRPV